MLVQRRRLWPNIDTTLFLSFILTVNMYVWNLTQNVDLLLVQCWSGVEDGGPTLCQRFSFHVFMSQPTFHVSYF